MEFVAIRTQAPMSALSQVIPKLHREVMAWLKGHGQKADGPPFIRYLVIDMPKALDIELGWPVAKAITQTGRLHGGALPAGRYVSLLFTGPYDQLVQANADLQAWAKAKHVTLEGRETPKGKAFASRAEFYITDPGNEPDPRKWKTEILYLVAR